MRMRLYQKNIYGVLGTIIVHLVLAIIFMIIKLSSDFRNLDQGILIDLSTPAEELIDEQPVIELSQNDAIYDIHDIAVNVASLPEEEFDIDEYIDQIKNEMITDGELTEDNFIDQWKQRALEAEEENNLQYIENDPINQDELEEKIRNAAEMASDYRGPTRIFYNLQGRNHTKLPLPIYKCPYGGKVTIEVVVDQFGKVLSGEVRIDESTTDDFCLYDAARKAALNSRFNSGSVFPAKQKGIITYIFAAQ